MYLCSICCKEIHDTNDGGKTLNLIHCMQCFRSFHGKCCMTPPEPNLTPIQSSYWTKSIETDLVIFDLTFICPFCVMFQDTELTINGEDFMHHKKEIFKCIVESLSMWVSHF